MRFVLALVAFVVAAVLLGLGIAQRSIVLDASRDGLTYSIEPLANYIVLEPDALTAREGKQTITASGAGTVFMAYGRSSDVHAWLGDSAYVSIGYDKKRNRLSQDLTVPKGAATDGGVSKDAQSPAGSDLWLDQFSADKKLSQTIDVPKDIAVIVASGSADPVPAKVSIAWHKPARTPWAGPLMAAGGVMFVIGLLLLLLAFIHYRRLRGPRRNMPPRTKGISKLRVSKSGGRGGTGESLQDASMPGLGRKPRRDSKKRANTAHRPKAMQRAGVRYLAAPLLLIPTLALSSCSSDYWPSFAELAPTSGETESPTPSASASVNGDSTDNTIPGVTLPQVERILREIDTFTADADAGRKTDELPKRFTGPALESRKTNYAIRGPLPSEPTLPAMPVEPLSFVLPQQTVSDPDQSWPRSVIAIGKSSADAKSVPTVVVLQQMTPREQYHVLYEQSLAPNVKFPDVAPASVGAPLISPNFKGLMLAPSQVSVGFADILTSGQSSRFAGDFDLSATDLDEKLDASTRKSEVEKANPTITLTATATAGDAPVIALATNDAGALVSTVVRRTEESKPNDGGTTGFADGSQAKALSGFTGQSAKGVQSTRDLQLLFYVPAVGSSDRIRLLGWSETLIAASEIK